MARPTVHDVAREAGVSLATVDRVLNARPGVRAETIRRVHTVIETLGYVRDAAAANLARQRDFSFVFLLPDRDSAFLASLRAEVAAVRDHVRLDRVTLRLISAATEDPLACVTAVDALVRERVDGIALMATETPQIRDAIRRAREAGVRVVTLVSDQPLSDRDHFVGINNIAAGRTAGCLMGRFIGARPGRILVIAGTMLARDHAERRLGFDQVMAEAYPNLACLPTLECHDDPDQIAALVPPLLRQHADILGLYSIGAGHRGLLRALTTACPRPVVIAHELTAQARLALLDGRFDAVLTQDVGHIIRSATRVLRAFVEGREIIAAQERISLDIFIKENLPDLSD